MKNFFKKLLTRILLIVFCAALVFSFYILLTTPNIKNFTYKPQTKAVVQSSDGVVIGEIKSKNITYINRNEIPDALAYAVIATEDRRFMRHHGIDLIGIARAMVRNLRAGEIVEGGSTITQQVAKNLFFSQEKSYIRKAREAVTALKLENKYSKDEILMMYLNEIYLGGGAYGVYEASDTYFNKEPIKLTTAECALLAGIIQAPSAYCPLSDEGLTYALERKDKVLQAMFEEEYITEELYNKAKKEKIRITPPNESEFTYGTCIDGCQSFMNRVYDECIQELSRYYHEDLGYKKDKAAIEAEHILFTQDLTIKSTLNYAMQKNALHAINEVLSDKDPSATAALVGVDNTSGNVLMYYGSNSYIDMAQSPRQPGSTIKPLYMLYLLDNNIATVNTVVKDEPININGYKPENFLHEYYGYTTMREALVHSMNSASLQYFSMGNIRDEIDFIKNLGISTITKDDYHMAFALGGMKNGIKPAQLCTAYASIANGGNLYTENYVDTIFKQDGTLLFQKNYEPRKVMKLDTSQKMADCLESVVLRGTGRSASPGYKTTGKTGTTDNNRDVWFAGTTANVTTSIWVGNVDAKEIENISSRWCTQIYRDTISSCIRNNSYSFKNLEKEKTEDMVDVLLPVNQTTNSEIDTVAKVCVPRSSLKEISDTVLYEATIDRTSGKLFVEGKCNEKDKEIRYYTKDELPTEYCNKLHLFNRFDIDF